MLGRPAFFFTILRLSRFRAFPILACQLQIVLASWLSPSIQRAPRKALIFRLYD